jgi:glycosyltransferase involved in cell wall biosynthesis
VPNLLAAADIFLYATPADSSDSLPRALLEAQAAGVPIVTTNTTGCPEVVTDGETGHVVQENANAIATAAITSLDNRKVALRQAKAGASTVRDRFSWESMATAYSEAFSKLAGRSSPLP